MGIPTIASLLSFLVIASGFGLALAGCKSDLEKRFALASELNEKVMRTTTADGWTGCKVGTLGHDSRALSVQCLDVDSDHLAKSVQPFLRKHCGQIARATFEGVIVSIVRKQGIWVGDVKTCELRWDSNEPRKSTD